MFYTPGFLGILLLKTGEPSGFGITVELLMLSSATTAVAGLFVGSQSIGGGGDSSSRSGIWSGSLVMELLCAIPFLCAVPPIFHQFANSEPLHAREPGAADTALGVSELLPALAILPFMLYQLAGFGTLSFVVSKAVNWGINFSVLVLIVASYICNRLNNFALEKSFVGVLVFIMSVATFHGVLKLKRM